MTTGLDLAHEAVDRCRQLAVHTDEPGATTRLFLSSATRGAQAIVSGWMREAHMTATLDAAGNLRGVQAGARNDSPRLYIGSHLDTVPRAGAFDGILGVILGIALVKQLERRPLPFTIEVIAFSEEEGVRFGAPFIGSRAFCGTLSDDLLQRRDGDGISVVEAIRGYGLDPAALPDAQFTAGAIGYLEFHIEQGPVLDTARLPVAVVDAIVGQTRLDVTFTGVANHAGTTPMIGRRDALTAAAEWALAVETLARDTAGLVATVGRFDAEPGATNVIAGRCRASLDVRHASDVARHAAAERLLERAQAIATARGLTVRADIRLDQAAVAMNASLIGRLERAAARQGITAPRLSSGAGHDAMIVAAHMPAAMLFVRSPGGISHHPDETVNPDDVAAALAVGGTFLDELAEAAL